MIPDYASELVSRITAAQVYPQWNLTPGEWLRVDALIKRSGVDMLASVAVKAASKRDIAHARYFLRAWQSLPPAATPGTVAATAPTGPASNVVPFDRARPAQPGRAAQAADWYADLV
ncbi:hypothetical protein OG357_23090 [Streptomyces sp. NBC_01255]|uniref:hypothetical protein n=1 Tax=Streptomyces sp. NBC_01255 TaxID=2903798 RepID=UPI002E354546|nr:hypothetical protein [Streptomyces sp. NBC_01255]